MVISCVIVSIIALAVMVIAHGVYFDNVLRSQRKDIITYTKRLDFYIDQINIVKNELSKQRTIIEDCSGCIPRAKKDPDQPS